MWLIAINLFVGVGIPLASAAFALHLRTHALADATAQTADLALVLSDQTERSFDGVDLVLNTVLARIRDGGVANDKDLRRLMATEAMSKALREEIRSLPQLGAVAIVNANAELINTSSLWPPPVLSASGRDMFTVLRDDPGITRYVSMPHLGGISGQWSVYLVRRITAPDGSFLGTILGAIELSYFEELYKKVLPRADGSIRLFRLDGVALAGVPRLPLHDRPTIVVSKVFERLNTDGNDYATIRAISPIDRLDRIVTSHAVKSYGLAVNVSATISTALAVWRKEIAFILAATVVLEVLLVVAVLLTLRERRNGELTAEALAGLAIAEHRASEVSDELSAVIGIMPGALVKSSFDPITGWIPRYASPTIAEVTGLSVAEFLKPGWVPDRIGGDDLLRLTTLRNNAGSQETSLDIGFRRPDGAQRVFHLRMRGYLLAGRREIITVWTDVTVERMLNDQITQSARLVQLGEMTTGIAHELNQPLAAMSMAAENALRQLTRLAEPLPRLQQKLDIIVRQADRAGSLIQRMQVFGRTRREPASSLRLAAVFEQVLELAESRLFDANVRLEIRLPADLPPVLATGVPLEQVLINLVVNACDAYGPPQATARFIVVAATAAPDCVTLTLSDFAGGIPTDVLERVFEPFFTTKPVGKGTGLGLSISYGIITDMGGTITAANHNGGARFSITLPQAA